MRKIKQLLSLEKNKGRTAGEYEPDKQHSGMAPFSDDGISTTLDTLGRGSGQPRDVPATYGEHGLNRDPNAAVARMTLLQQIKSKVPYTKENKLRKEADRLNYKEKGGIKTTAQRVLEAMEARDAEEREKAQIKAQNLPVTA